MKEKKRSFKPSIFIALGLAIVVSLWMWSGQIQFESTSSELASNDTKKTTTPPLKTASLIKVRVIESVAQSHQTTIIISGRTEENKRVTKEDIRDEDHGQLNVTIDDDTEIIMAELQRNMQGIIQPTGDVTTYIMNDAHYAGNYTATGGSGLGASGTANLNINFGADTINLNLGGIAIYSLNPIFSATGFTGLGLSSAGAGTADGTFNDNIGNSVTGNFTYNDGNSDNGTYNVTSTQTLY